MYDCSCYQSKELPSLNNCLLSGDLWLNDLCIILWFRMHKYGMCADMEKAFIHVQLNKDDCDYTQFQWLANPSDPNSELVTYRFRVVLFETVWSLFMFNTTLLFHLSQYSSTTAKGMLENVHVDNIKIGCESDEAAVCYYSTARMIMSEANLTLEAGNQIMSNWRNKWTKMAWVQNQVQSDYSGT